MFSPLTLFAARTGNLGCWDCKIRRKNDYYTEIGGRRLLTSASVIATMSSEEVADWLLAIVVRK